MHVFILLWDQIIIMKIDKSDPPSHPNSDNSRFTQQTENYLASEMKTYLQLAYYDSCRNHFGNTFENSLQPRNKNNNKTGPSVSSVLVRFIQEDVCFAPDEFQKDFAYKTTVFLFSPMTTLFDIYIQALVFWDLIDTGQVQYSKNSNIITENFFNDDPKTEGDKFDDSSQGNNRYLSSKFLQTEKSHLTKNSQVFLFYDFNYSFFEIIIQIKIL